MNCDYCCPYVNVVLSVYQFLCWGALQDSDHRLQIFFNSGGSPDRVAENKRKFSNFQQDNLSRDFRCITS